MVHEEDADIVNIQSGELLQLQRESSQCVVLCCVVLCCVVLCCVAARGGLSLPALAL